MAARRGRTEHTTRLPPEEEDKKKSFKPYQRGAAWQGHNRGYLPVFPPPPQPRVPLWRSSAWRGGAMAAGRGAVWEGEGNMADGEEP